MNEVKTNIRRISELADEIQAQYECEVKKLEDALADAAWDAEAIMTQYQSNSEILSMVGGIKETCLNALNPERRELARKDIETAFTRIRHDHQD